MHHQQVTVKLDDQDLAATRRYLVLVMPDDYDVNVLTAEDIVDDPRIQIVDAFSLVEPVPAELG